MLRITAKQQLMREIVDILSVLTSEAKLVWGERASVFRLLTVLMWPSFLQQLPMSASRHTR